MKLERVLEPEVMDSADEARDYDEMDHSQVNQAFVDDFLRDAPHAVRILDLGTGTAQIPIALCQRAAHPQVVAVDLAAHMLDLANRNIEANGLIERVEVRQVDAKGLPFDDELFEAVMSNSIIHHIPDPMQCLSEAVRVTKVGGHLFFRDLLRPQDKPQLDHLVQAYAGDENEHSQKMFAESLHAALSLDEIQGLVGQLGFDPSSVEQTTDRHWTWSTSKSV